MSWSRHICLTAQALASAVAPLEGVYSVLVRQATSLAPNDLQSFHTMSVAVRVRNGTAQIARRTGTGWSIKIRSKFNSNGREIIMVIGRSTPSVPVQSRADLVKLGFTLQHVA